MFEKWLKETIFIFIFFMENSLLMMSKFDILAFLNNSNIK